MNVSDFMADENTFWASFFRVLKKVHKIHFSILGFPVIIMEAEAVNRGRQLGRGGMAMRSEKEMMDLILEVAEKDERIRGVYMTGSRTNPNAPKDVFQDYDIVYIVRETGSFREDREWIDVFGRRLYMQYPDDRPEPGTDIESCYGYLMQLADGNRLDLHVVTPEFALKDIAHDRLCRILMDKDMALPEIPGSTDEDHWVERPGEEDYLHCCNEFWWMLNSIGKGLWRGEIPYTMDMLNRYGRPELIKMLAWNVGIENHFACSVGKFGKYLRRYLAEDYYQRLMKTYPPAEEEAIWRSVFEMCDLFDETARKAGRELGYAYDEKEAYHSRLYLDCTYALPKGAEEFVMVRKMKAGDGEEAARIWLEGNLDAHSFVPEEYWKGNYEEVKLQLQEAEVYVYEDDDGIQGFAGLENGYIQGIFVKRGMRSRGIGRSLLNLCKGKYERLSLHVYAGNKKALNFYVREGFQAEKEQLDGNTGQWEYEMVWRKG